MNTQENQPHIFAAFHQEIIACIEALQARGEIPENLTFERLTVEQPREINHGELSTNAAMILAKPAKLAPKILAEKIGTELATRKKSQIENWSVEGPGFLNWNLKSSIWHRELLSGLEKGKNFGKSTFGNGKSVNIEFVSANPTGPLHVANARGAVFGDVLARLLTAIGYDVTKEYYMNDAGSQIEVLVNSLFHRYKEANNLPVGELPPDYYPGEYVIELAKKIKEKDGDKWLHCEEVEWKKYFRLRALGEIKQVIQKDLKAIGVVHDNFVSEKGIIAQGSVEAVIKTLSDENLIYEGVLEKPKGTVPDDWEARPQKLFRSTYFGDVSDRALVKSDGTYTYFAADIAYHWDKLQRGYSELVNVWGADHIGYVKRLSAAVKALSGGKVALDVKICQLVTLLENGQPAKMSKRSGNFVRLTDAVEKVQEKLGGGDGAGIVRFIMLTRSNDAHLDFDFAKVVEKSHDNPIFYVQYAHARACSVIHSANDNIHLAPFLKKADLDILKHGEWNNIISEYLSKIIAPEELALIRQIVSFPKLIEQAALSHEPHRIAFYLTDLAAIFHHLWTVGRGNTVMRFIREDDIKLTIGRLLLVKALKQTLANGLDVIGIEAQEELI